MAGTCRSSPSPWRTRTASSCRGRTTTCQFEISGPGEIIATDNGDATCLMPFQATQRPAFNGLALVIVRGKPGQTGNVTLTARSPVTRPCNRHVKVRMMRPAL